MCTVSFMGYQWSKTVPDKYPWVQPMVQPGTAINTLPPTRAEFDTLKAEVAALRELLLAAKEFDAATGQPDCEMDEKVALIKQLAEFVGVSMEDLFD
jgi:hypothetical protein